jgi:osmotically-inducible protein OsmY
MKRDREFDQRKRSIEIRDTLRRRLKTKTSLWRVRCDFINGRAILWGKVISEADRELAEELVLSLPEVDAIESRLVVEKLQELNG